MQDGWTGKNFACHQLALSATGNFLLFLDADVELHQGVIESALHRMEEKGLSLLSLFCNQHTPTAGEKLTIPLMNYLLLTLLPLRLIERRTEPIFSAACGQFMLFTGSSYRLHLWHKQVRAHVTEDLAIMNLVKSSKLKGEGLLSGPLVSCRMYDGFRSAAQGFGKNFISPFNDSILLFLIFTLILLLGPLFILAGAEAIEIAALLSMITATRLMTNAQSGHPLWYVALHPFQMASFGYIAITSIFKRLTHAVEWKGRLISLTLPASRQTADRAAVPAEH